MIIGRGKTKCSEKKLYQSHNVQHKQHMAHAENSTCVPPPELPHGSIRIFVIFLTSSWQMPVSYVDQTTIAYFQIPSNSLFISNPAMRLHTVPNADMSQMDSETEPCSAYTDSSLCVTSSQVMADDKHPTIHHFVSF
jgi:hypothetical protein